MCEFCGEYENYKTPMQRLAIDVKGMVARGYSEAYVEAVLYGRYRNTASINKISEMVEKEHKLLDI